MPSESGEVYRSAGDLRLPGLTHDERPGSGRVGVFCRVPFKFAAHLTVQSSVSFSSSEPLATADPGRSESLRSLQRSPEPLPVGTRHDVVDIDRHWLATSTVTHSVALFDIVVVVRRVGVPVAAAGTALFEGFHRARRQRDTPLQQVVPLGVLRRYATRRIRMSPSLMTTYVARRVNDAQIVFGPAHWKAP